MSAASHDKKAAHYNSDAAAICDCKPTCDFKKVKGIGNMIEQDGYDD